MVSTWGAAVSCPFSSTTVSVCTSPRGMVSLTARADMGTENGEGSSVGLCIVMAWAQAPWRAEAQGHPQQPPAPGGLAAGGRGGRATGWRWLHHRRCQECRRNYSSQQCRVAVAGGGLAARARHLTHLCL